MIARDVASGPAYFLSAGTLAGLNGRQQGDADAVPSVADLPLRKPRLMDDEITVLIAASAARQTLGADQVAAAVEEGIHAAMPSARVMKLSDIEANAGFVEEIVRLSGGAIREVGLFGLRGEGTAGRLGLFGRPGNLTAVIAIDEAVEPSCLAQEYRDATRASSHLAGQLILAALEHDVRRIIIGCGDSGANDGGLGMASMLGIRFLDGARTEIAEAGGLLRLATIDMSHRDPRLQDVTIEAVVNPSNDLLGPRGVMRVHGTGRGASPAQVLRLERGLERYSAVVQESLGIDVAALAGGGASGGLGAGLVAFLGARLRTRIDFLQVCPEVQEILGATDLVITVEDHSDAPPTADVVTPWNTGAGGPLERVPAWVARQAQAKGLPVISLPGDPSMDSLVNAGAGALPVVRAALVTGEQAARHASARLREASTAALRRVLRGWNRAAEQA